jgi:hypothetical protein
MFYDIAAFMKDCMGVCWDSVYSIRYKDCIGYIGDSAGMDSNLVWHRFLEQRCRIGHEVVDTSLVPLWDDALELTHRACQLHTATRAS